MHCSKCGAAHAGKNRLCDECTRVLAGVPSKNILTSNTGSVPAGQDHPAPGNLPPAEGPRGRWADALQRYRVIPIRLRGKPVTANSMVAVGAAGLAMAGYGFFNLASSLWWSVLMIPSFLGLIAGLDLKRKRYARVAQTFNLEANQAGEVFYTEIGGQCPACDGELKLKDLGFKKHKETMVLCALDPNHKWKFDPNLLGDL